MTVLEKIQKLTDVLKSKKRIFSYDLITSNMAEGEGVCVIRVSSISTQFILALSNHCVEFGSEFYIRCDKSAGLVVIEILIEGS